MKYLYIIVLTTIGLLLSSCQEFLDINADPNNPQEIPLESRLIGAITMTNGAAMWRGAREVSAVCQYTASGNETSSPETWRFTSSYFFWQNSYTWAIPNCVDMVVMGKAEGAPHYAGAGRTLEALVFGMLTDQLGAIPVSEAYDGVTTARLTPAFDSQEEVYAQVIEKLDEAIALFNETENAKGLNLDNGDIMYQGDIDKWRRFAYALKARYLNHLSKKSIYDPQAVIEACSNAFNSDGMDAEFPYLDNGTATEANPWSDKGYGGFTSATAPRYFSFTQFFVDLMKTAPVTNDSLLDPRIGIIMNPAPSDGEFRGLIPGQGVPGGIEVNGDNYGRVTGGFYSRPTSPFPFITYAEVKFIEAEARLRSGDSGGALAAYQEGVSANMRKLGVAGDDIASYWNTLVDNGVQQHFDDLTSGLSHIMRQKYIAQVFNPETWVDMRRMDYSQEIYGPSLNRPTNLNPLFNEGEWIRAMIVEGNEEVRNGANVGNNTPVFRLKTPLWWDTLD
ncbi:SusD/RagB family nutrient-binding outer membrane lipoprotein [Phaeodactylibacter xiamenensis]|uniref:SusD/RagB family nutrient-binding outer membrane lipoprotein n=1 Tax=Phaeodactylibacter xiamenensis TaxID=1524460 RepID=UPI003CCBA8AF